MWLIGFEQEALEDLEWYRRRNKRLYAKCLDLIRDIVEDPRDGIGKPERLRHVEGEAWSRRVSQKDRIVYSIVRNLVIVSSFRTHYSEH